MEAQNRRRHHRINYDGVARLVFEDTAYDGCRIQNISLTGMFISVDFHGDAGKRCLVGLVQDTDTEKELLQALGEIVWRSREGVGLRFLSMKLDSYMSLVSELIENAEQPELILNEIPRWYPFEITFDELELTSH